MAQQPDEIFAKPNTGDFTIHAEGQFAGVCVDVVNMGEKLEQYQGKPERLTPKCKIGFFCGERDEQGAALLVWREFTISTGDKSNLRAFLEAWRGKSYAPDELEQGAPLHKLVGAPALITIEHNPVGDRTYANINSIAKLPPVMAGAVPTLADYERPEWIAKQKAKYAEDATAYRKRVNAPISGKAMAGATAGSAMPSSADGDDDLPF